MPQDTSLLQRVRGSSRDVDLDCPDPTHDKDDVVLLMPSEDSIEKCTLQQTIAVTTGKMQAKTTPAGPSRTRTNAASKIIFLDGLRGLAAMLVVVQHAGYMKVHVGQPAVDVFFVLSAFLLTMIFEKKARLLFQQNASYTRWKYALIDYFARRFLRVYPLFAIVAVYLTVYSPADKYNLFNVHNAENYNLFKVFTFKTEQRHHVFWTLPLEITYYFIIPFFVVAMLKIKKYWLVPMVPLTYLVMYSGLYWNRAHHMPLKPHLPTFLCGSMAAFIYAKIDQWVSQRQFVFRWYHVIVLRTFEYMSLALLLSSVFNGLFFDWVAQSPIPNMKGPPFVSLPASVVIVCEMLQRGAISSVLEWSLLRGYWLTPPFCRFGLCCSIYQSKHRTTDVGLYLP